MPKRPAAKPPARRGSSKGSGKGDRKGGIHYTRDSWVIKSVGTFRPGAPNFNPVNQKMVLLLARFPNVSHSWMVEFLKKEKPKNKGVNHKKAHEIHSGMYSVSPYHPEVTAEIRKLMHAELSAQRQAITGTI